MKKLLLLLSIFASTSYAQMGNGQGITISKCYHNAELYAVRMNVGTTPADCPDYVKEGPVLELGGKHIDRVNASQNGFIKNLNNPHECSFTKTNRFEDPNL